MGRPAARSGVSRRGWPVLLVALVCIGCGRPTGEISGTVMYRGKPLPSGTLTCLDVNNQALGSSAISQGSYSIARVPVGPVKIIVTTPPVSLGNPTQPRAPKKTDKDSPRNRSPDPRVPAVVIPAQYGNPDQSGLTYTVQAGAQQHNIDLK